MKTTVYYVKISICQGKSIDGIDKKNSEIPIYPKMKCVGGNKHSFEKRVERLLLLLFNVATASPARTGVSNIFFLKIRKKELRWTGGL